eukprot:SAG31_NODE_625_length_13462_cov_3.785153_4_plen_152_part_00
MPALPSTAAERERSLALQLATARTGLVRLDAAMAALDRAAMAGRVATAAHSAAAAVDGVVAVRGPPKEPGDAAGGDGTSPAIWLDVRDFIGSQPRAAVGTAAAAGCAAEFQAAVDAVRLFRAPIWGSAFLTMSIWNLVALPDPNARRCTGS